MGGYHYNLKNEKVNKTQRKYSINKPARGFYLGTLVFVSDKIICYWLSDKNGCESVFTMSRVVVVVLVC